MAKAKKKTAAGKKGAAKTTVPKKKAIASAAVACVGQAIPDFEAASTGGKTLNSKMLKGKKLVLYFYPKDSTPGCTLEGQDFTRLHKQFKAAGAEVYGISRDSMKSHENFKDKQCYTIDLLSDEDEKLCNLFGVIKMKNMYGKKVRGIERSTFVIGPDGKIVKEWRGVKVPGHAEEVLEVVKSL